MDKQILKIGVKMFKNILSDKQKKELENIKRAQKKFSLNKYLVGRLRLAVDFQFFYRELILFFLSIGPYRRRRTFRLENVINLGNR